MPSTAFPYRSSSALNERLLEIHTHDCAKDPHFRGAYSCLPVLGPDLPRLLATWAVSEQSRFIRASASYKSRKVDEAVSGILAKITDDDYLALACMERLIGRSYDEQIRNYCERRILESKGSAARLQPIISKLQSAKKAKSQPLSRE